MQITVIIPTYNAASYLKTLLEKLKKQTVSFELIIIDSSSTDNTLDIARRYTENIISIPTHEFDHGGTRTKAAKTAHGDIIVFLTQDALPTSNETIQSLVHIFDTPSIAATYGRQLAHKETSLFGKHLRQFNYPKNSSTRTLNDTKKYGIKTAFLSDSFAAYRKSSLENIGWFKDGLIVGEDTYAGAKLILQGYAIHYNAKATVYHSHSYTLSEEFKRYFDIGVFHQKEHWILDRFGKAEGEGGKYVRSEFYYLLRQHAYHKIPEFFIRNGLKYIGYKFGQHHKYISYSFVQRLSMHKSWWDK